MFDPQVEKAQRSPDELKQALVQLERRRSEIKKDKKNMAKDYGDQLKEVDFEIAGILQQLS